MTVSNLALAAAAFPLAASVLLLVIWPARLLLEGLLSALPGRPTRWLPPTGRVSRVVAWCGLFGALLPLLPVPALLWQQGDAGGLLRLTAGTWLVAVAAAVVGLCAGVAAWADESGRGTWALVTGLAGLSVAGVASRVEVVSMAVLDLAGLLTAVGLALTGRDDQVDSRALRQSLRRYLVVLVVSSWMMWWGYHAGDGGSSMMAAGLLLRAGVAGLHAGSLASLVRLPTPMAMMVAGAVMPTAAMLAASKLAGSTATGVVLAVLVVAVLLPATHAWDLRKVAARLAIVVLSVGLATVCLLPADAQISGTVLAPPASSTALRDGRSGLAVASAALGAALTVYLVGAVARVVGHSELSRMSGLAARVPGLLGWSVAGAMLLSGAFPFATAVGRWLLAMLPDVPWVTAAGLSGLGALVLLTMLLTVHRVFLGTPKLESEPVELAGRERLILVLLAAAATCPTLAPFTLLRGL